MPQIPINIGKVARVVAGIVVVAAISYFSQNPAVLGASTVTVVFVLREIEQYLAQPAKVGA